jgi:hypothetical protein
MRETTQSGSVTYRMGGRSLGGQHRRRGGEPMQTIRASAIALPFIALALLIAMLSSIVGAGA